MESIELVTILWECADDDGNYNHEYDDFMIDLENSKIYKSSSDAVIDDPYFFQAFGNSINMHRLIEEDDSFLSDNLTGKWLSEAIKAKLVEPKVDGIVRLHKWERPTYGEMTLIYEIHSFKSNHPMDPDEWDLNINCLGVLGYNYKLEKLSDEKKPIN